MLALDPGAGLPCCTLTERDEGPTEIASGTGSAVITSESITTVGDPLAPAIVTMMVSTCTPGASPADERDQRTIPLPWPLPRVRVFHSLRLPALHQRDDAPSPVTAT